MDLSAAAMLEAKIHYVELEEFRTSWTRPLLYDNQTAEPAPASMPETADWRLVFDENILALVQHAVTPRGMYPDGADRAKIVADYLQLDKPRIVLGLRGFTGMIPSLYCEALKSTPFKPFDRFCSLPLSEMSWLPLIDSIRAAFPESEMLLYQAEKLHGREAQLLSEVTGIKASAFNLLENPERLGFSQEAVDWLHDVSKFRTVSRADVRSAVKALPKGAKRPGYAPWSEDEKGQLNAQYMRDLEVLRERAAQPENKLKIFEFR
ncbi:hypothetical protein [Donghicola mangrovi]|uniref:Uncharacterized protein n=1 Tax=Donghicola mangrovi TaxID=2729614 RepID=A0A850QFL9_9RHOB|nr:hypothetical protein [Donghicola mangrovi]NVO25738.1 hypothetical protein [Donghicola mangrovi]